MNDFYVMEINPMTNAQAGILDHFILQIPGLNSSNKAVVFFMNI